MHRLFVGLRPPAPVRARLMAMMGGVPGARWQSDDQLHLTLRFIGEVDRRTAEEVALALSNLRYPPFELAIAGVGSFGSRGRVNALWAGVAPRDGVAGLHRKVDAALVRLGLPTEGRAYLPHLTLARMHAPASAADRFLADHAALTGPAFAVEHFLLFESRLGHGGAAYEAVERYALVR
jgi:RNA 2',3'-cyclic 3'-phosphodiesterase